MTNYLWSSEDCARLTEHANPDVRIWALEKIVELYPENAKDALLKAIDDENSLVSHRAVQFVPRIEDKGPFSEPLLKKFDSAEDWLAGQCAIVLGSVGCKEAIPNLTERLGDDDTDPTLWGSILLALGELQDDDTFKVLEELETKVDDPQRAVSIVNALLMYGKSETYIRLVRNYLKSGAAHNGSNWMIALLTNHLSLTAINYVLEEAKFPEPKENDSDKGAEKELDEVFSSVERGVGIAVSETPDPDWMKLAGKAYKNKNYQDYARALLAEIPKKLRERYPDEQIAFDEDSIKALHDKLTRNELLILSSLSPFASGWKGAMSRMGAANLVKDEARFITACLFQISASKNWDKEIDDAKGDEEKLLAILTTPTDMDSDRIVDEVASLGESVVSSLIRILEAWPGNTAAMRVIRVLEKMKSESSIPALIECGTHPDEYVRAAATSALAAFGEQILDHIEPTLKEGMIYRNVTALSVLARVPTEKSVDIIMSNYDKLVSLGANMISFVCRQLGSNRLISPLRGMLSSDNMSTIGETLALLCAINDAPFPEAEGLLEDRKRRVRELRRRQRRSEGTTEEIKGAGPVEEVGRNDPCPCGSGKKYKNCCMKTRTAPVE